jgi:hypothetical protein
MKYQILLLSVVVSFASFVIALDYDDSSFYDYGDYGGAAGQQDVGGGRGGRKAIYREDHHEVRNGFVRACNTCV